MTNIFSFVIYEPSKTAGGATINPAETPNRHFKAIVKGIGRRLKIFDFKDFFNLNIMASTRAKKSEQLKTLEEKFKNAKGISFASFTKLTVEEAQGARRELRSKGMSYTVVKKTLIGIAAKNTGLPEVNIEALKGNVTVIISEKEEIQPLSIIKHLRKTYTFGLKKSPKFEFAGCIFQGQFYGPIETAVFANIPSREESLGRIVGMLRSGPQKLHNVLGSGFSKVCNVLKNADKFVSQNS